MNRLNSTLGSYLPSFFKIEVGFPFPSTMDNAQPIDEKWISIFTHEYIHFLQDISTYVGINNAYVYSEHIHGLVCGVYCIPQGQLHIPVNLPNNYGNIDLNRFVNTEGMGTLAEFDEFFLAKVKKEYKKVPFQNKYVNSLTQIFLKSAKGDKVVFGSRAIMESMAYLIEREITCGFMAAPDYPYHAAEMVVDHLFPEFGKDKLRVIALCDACLQFSEPGKMFIQSLEIFKEQNFVPQNANLIIDHFYSCPCEQMGVSTKMMAGFISMSMMVGERLKLYLKGKEFSPFHHVVYNLLGFGMRERINNRYFMLDIVRNGYVLRNPLMNRYVKETGTPIIKDSNEDYWFVPPKGANISNYWIEYFPAIEQVYKCLAEGNTICEMIPWCEKSSHAIVDDRCYMEPWKRVENAYLCPYAVLWRHWNLQGYTPTEA